MSTLINFKKKRKIGIIYLPNSRIIRKFSISKKSNRLIKNEIKGIRWYFSLKNNSNSNYLKKTSKNHIDLETIKGKQVNYLDPLKKNLEYVEQVVNHYKKIWPNKHPTPYHGDLTLSNIIFIKKKSPLIIDWENFSKNKTCWGFDLAYFLISTVALPNIFLKRSTFDKNELHLLKIIWQKTFNNKNFEYLKKPINYFKRNYQKIFILRNYSNYYPNLLSKRKIEEIHEALI